jgi:hypothetical protein
MTTPQDRRFEPRFAANARAIVVAPGLEMPCRILDSSGGGLRLRLDRKLALPARVQIVEMAQGLAIEAEVVWSKGQEAGLKRNGQASVRGLTPSRFAAAKAAYLRAGGR